MNTRRLPHGSPPPIGLSAQGILNRILHDAQFWELLRLRGGSSFLPIPIEVCSWRFHMPDAFISRLIEQTADLADVDLRELLSHLAADTTRPSPDAASQIASVYNVLLLTPAEYLPRATHIEFLKRGLIADVTIYLTLRFAKQTVLSDRDLLGVRKFLKRSIDHIGLIENIVCLRPVYA